MPSAPPPAMTWGKALPILALCVLFDALRLFFEGFWFFGPALLGFFCISAASGYVGTSIATAACGSGAVGAGVLGFGALVIFGTIMDMAIGILGWGTVTLLIVLTNSRLYKAAAAGWLWSLLALGLSEVPLLGALPSLTVAHARLYYTQIREDKKSQQAYKKSAEAAARAARSAALARAQAEIPQKVPQGA